MMQFENTERLVMAFFFSLAILAVFCLLFPILFPSLRSKWTGNPLSCKMAIPLAVVGMWCFSFAGICVLVKFILVPPNQWWFRWIIGILGTTWVRHPIWSIVPFYLAWTGVQLLGSGFAGIVIGLSGFARPLRTTFSTVTIYYALLSVLRVIICPWTEFHDIAPLAYFVTLMVYLLSTLLLIGSSVLVAWFMPRYYLFFQRPSSH